MEMASENVFSVEPVVTGQSRAIVSDVGARVKPIQTQLTFGLSKQATLGQEGTQRVVQDYSI